MRSGQTTVLCAVTITENVPPWLLGQNQAWLTAEYSMLPGSTRNRKAREARTGRADGRSQEIQRLIGRALRSVVDLHLLPEITFWVDCDVLDADGGTRTASINGACIALFDALNGLRNAGRIKSIPMRSLVSAVSVGIVDGQVLVDLDYREDSAANMDLNVVCAADGHLVEVQGSAEGRPIPPEDFDELLRGARRACEAVRERQRRELGILSPP